jgi:NAD(P)-dependent dehydrogenase (short-subunit alcohol dehydrogenase family)
MSKPTAVVVGVGAERGLGAALCRRFAQGGYHVLVAGRTQAKIGRVAEIIAAAGGSAEPIAMDATRESAVAGLFERAMAPGDGFDPTELVDTATYDDPHRYSVGMRHVFVNGVETATDNAATGATPGAVLRSGRDTETVATR